MEEYYSNYKYDTHEILQIQRSIHIQYIGTIKLTGVHL